MIVIAIKSFYDKKEGVTRNMGNTFNVSEERYKELNSTQFGILVEEVAEATISNEIKKTSQPKKTAKK